MWFGCGFGVLWVWLLIVLFGFGIVLEWFWVCIGMVLGWFWDGGWLWNGFGFVLVWFGDGFGVDLDLFFDVLLWLGLVIGRF